MRHSGQGRVMWGSPPAEAGFHWLRCGKQTIPTAYRQRQKARRGGNRPQTQQAADGPGSACQEVQVLILVDQRGEYLREFLRLLPERGSVPEAPQVREQVE